MAKPKKGSGKTSSIATASAPINLKKEFGRSHKVEYDPGYYAEYGKHAKVEDPWYQIIPGRLGNIWVFGANELAVTTNRRGPVAKRLVSLPFGRVWLDADDGVTVRFPPEHFREVARIIRARTKRTLSESQRRALTDGGARYRYQKNSPGSPTSGADGKPQADGGDLGR